MDKLRDAYAHFDNATTSTFDGGNSVNNNSYYSGRSGDGHSSHYSHMEESDDLINRFKLKILMDEFGLEILNDNAKQIMQGLSGDDNGEIGYSECLALIQERIEHSPEYEVKVTSENKIIDGMEYKCITIILSSME